MNNLFSIQSVTVIISIVTMLIAGFTLLNVMWKDIHQTLNSKKHERLKELQRQLDLINRIEVLILIRDEKLKDSNESELRLIKELIDKEVHGDIAKLSKLAQREIKEKHTLAST